MPNEIQEILSDYSSLAAAVSPKLPRFPKSPKTSTQPPQPTMSLADLNKTPLLELTIKDILGIWGPIERNSQGCDKASYIRGQKLWDAVGEDAATLIKKYLVEPKYQNKAARWVLRGADVDRAIIRGFIAQMLSAFHYAESDRVPSSAPNSDWLSELGIPLSKTT